MNDLTQTKLTNALKDLSTDAGAIADLASDPAFVDARARQLQHEQFLAIRREEGLKIDPSTAECTWRYVLTLDPYGVLPDLPEECQQVGRECFARAPGSDVWVEFGDLPEETREALRKRGSSAFLEDDIPF